jgi:hypothetical protein
MKIRDTSLESNRFPLRKAARRVEREYHLPAQIS